MNFAKFTRNFPHVPPCRKRPTAFFDRLNLSVPDADTLIRCADVLEVTVPELLGAKLDRAPDADRVAEQLSRINEQLAIKNRRARRIWKAVVIALFVILLLQLLAIFVFSKLSPAPDPSHLSVETGVPQAFDRS